MAMFNNRLFYGIQLHVGMYMQACIQSIIILVWGRHGISDLYHGNQVFIVALSGYIDAA